MVEIEAKVIEAAADPTTANKSSTQYLTDGTKWRNSSTGDVFICVDAGAGVWEKIHDESISDTEIGFIDGVTAGTSTASKAMVLDANQELNSIGVVRSVDKIISTAEVKALNATPITVLPAVGSGVYPEFLGAYVLLDYNSAAYADDAGEDIVFQNLSAGDEVSQSADGTLFDGTADACVWVGPKGGDAVTTTTLVDNGGFEITIQTGEWITGDSPLKVRLYYRLITKADLEAIA